MEAGAEDANLIICVTTSDELNILAGLMAKKMGTRHTIARVRNPDYSSQRDFMRNQLGFSMIVNPELEAASEICRVLSFPSAVKVDTFSRGKVELAEFFVEDHSRLNGVELNQFHKITDFAYILNQLLMVIGLEKSLHFNKSLIHYQDYIMYCAIKKIGREGHIQYFCMPELLEVFRYDHKYGTSFAYSKRIALELASVTAAAQKLGIHRNTMEYRLRKFNDLSGISRLLFTYKILDLYPEILEEKDIL